MTIILPFRAVPFLLAVCCGWSAFAASYVEPFGAPRCISVNVTVASTASGHSNKQQLQGAERIARALQEGLAALATEEQVKASRFKFAPDCLADMRLDQRVLRVVDLAVAAERTCPKPSEHLGQKCGHRIEFSMTECSSVRCAPAYRNTFMFPTSAAGGPDEGVVEFALFTTKRLLATDEIAADAVRKPR